MQQNQPIELAEAFAISEKFGIEIALYDPSTKKFLNDSIFSNIENSDGKSIILIDSNDQGGQRKDKNDNDVGHYTSLTFKKINEGKLVAYYADSIGGQIPDFIKEQLQEKKIEVVEVNCPKQKGQECFTRSLFNSLYIQQNAGEISQINDDAKIDFLGKSLNFSDFQSRILEIENQIVIDVGDSGLASLNPETNISDTRFRASSTVPPQTQSNQSALPKMSWSKILLLLASIGVGARAFSGASTAIGRVIVADRGLGLPNSLSLGMGALAGSGSLVPDHLSSSRGLDDGIGCDTTGGSNVRCDLPSPPAPTAPAPSPTPTITKNPDGTTTITTADGTIITTTTSGTTSIIEPNGTTTTTTKKPDGTTSTTITSPDGITTSSTTSAKGTTTTTASGTTTTTTADGTTTTTTANGTTTTTTADGTTTIRTTDGITTTTTPDGITTTTTPDGITTTTTPDGTTTTTQSITTTTTAGTSTTKLTTTTTPQQTTSTTISYSSPSSSFEFTTNHTGEITNVTINPSSTTSSPETPIITTTSTGLSMNIGGNQYSSEQANPNTITVTSPDGTKENFNITKTSNQTLITSSDGQNTVTLADGAIAGIAIGSLISICACCACCMMNSTKGKGEANQNKGEGRGSSSLVYPVAVNGVNFGLPPQEPKSVVNDPESQGVKGVGQSQVKK